MRKRGYTPDEIDDLERELAETRNRERQLRRILAILLAEAGGRLEIPEATVLAKKPTAEFSIWTNPKTRVVIISTEGP